MAFKKGQSGNPGGKRKEKILTDELRRVLNQLQKCEDGKERKRLTGVVEAWVSKAESGDMAAIKEILDRTEGKAPQPLVGAEDEDGLPTAIQIKIVDPCK